MLNTKYKFMSRLRKRLPSVVLGLCTLATATAQDVSKLYSVDHYTGVANISIPITSYQLKNNELGVSLSYNTKGVPVREFAGVAGTHWSLAVGGGINRSVKGIPDEWYSAGSSVSNDGIIASNAALIKKYTHYKGRLVVSKENPTQRADQNVYRDPESDEYNVSVGSMQFTFYIGQDGGIFVSSQEKYGVQFFVNGQPYTAPTTYSDRYGQDIDIRVTDRQTGTVYFFSPSVKEIRQVKPYFRSPYMWYHLSNCGGQYDTELAIGGQDSRINVSWKLDKILTTDNETVLYTYKTFIMPPGFVTDSTWYQVKETGNVAVDTFSSGSSDPYSQTVDTYQLVKQVILPYGKTIELVYDTVNTRLELQRHASTAGNQAYPYFSKLDAVLYKEQDKQMKYTFDYSYFHTPSAQSSLEETNTYLGDEPDRYSLKLKGINVVDMNSGSASRLYTFGYNDKKQRRFGRGLDYYGYYNGGTSLLGHKGHSLPDLTTRTTDETSMQYGILKTITSATGSKATFSYSSNDALTVVSSDLIPSQNWTGTGTTGDGLRLKDVVISDENEPNNWYTHSFSYSDGQYLLPGGVFDVISHYANVSNNDIHTFYRYENFMNPGYFARGSNHGYSTVSELKKDAAGASISRTDYTFTNFKDGASPARTQVVGGGISHIGFPFTRKQYVRTWELGLPVIIKSFDNNGYIVKEENYAYNFIIDSTSAQTLKVLDTNAVPTHIKDASPYDPKVYQGFTSCLNLYYYRLVKDPYRPFKGVALVNQKTEKIYTGSTTYATYYTDYSYDSRNNLKSVRQHNSDGNYTEQRTIYNYDLTPDTSTVLAKMVTDDMEKVVATETWLNGTNSGTRNSNSRLLNASLFQYTTVGNSVINKVVYNTALDQPLSYSTYMGSQNTISPQVSNTYANPGAMASYVLKVSNVEKFNTKGNPVETYVPQSDAYKSMIWDTLSGKKTADVVNARQHEIVYAGFDQAAAEQNLTSNSAHLSFYNGSVMSIPSIGYTVPVSKPLVGKGVYVLEPVGSTTKELYTSSLESGKKYRATFWASSNAVPAFGIEGGTQFSLNQIAQKGEYKQYEVLFTPTATGQKIGFHSNSGYIALEEIRIHPVGAVMENYRYTPLFGTSVTTDALGRMTFYEYDGLGRLVLTRDQDGNILKQTEYGIGAQY
ncbi:hypothetical protein [Sphingobacterium sp.]|uniref:hypothetical protein n=1 Tax=Sphingobacterium sp. TaxID=341027 RepID=UPI0031CF729F